MKLKLFFGSCAAAVLLVGCGQSDVGAPADTEQGADSQVYSTTPAPLDNTTTDPGVDPAMDNNIDRPIPPSTQPLNVAPTNQPSAPDPQAQVEPEQLPQESGVPNEQGTQTTPEPRTGDDANPDAVNP